MTKEQMDRYFALMCQREHTKADSQELATLSALRRHSEPHKGFQEHRHYTGEPFEQAIMPSQGGRKMFVWLGSNTSRRGGA